MNNTILLIGTGRHIEHIAAGAIKPGHLVKLNSDDEVAVHGVEGGVAEKLFAVEDALQGHSIDDAYAADDVTMLHCARSGDEIYAYIKSGQVVAKGDILVSGGDGTLITEGSVASATVIKDYIAVSRAAIDLSGSGDVDTRVCVRVL